MSNTSQSVYRRVWKLVQSLFVFVSLLLAIYICVDRSLASERSTVWGSKPVLEHFVMNPELARELRKSISLTGEEIESIAEIAQLEADMVQALERESLDVIGNPRLDLTQKRKQIAEIGYNQRLLQIVNENQVSLKQRLGSGKYEMLVDWVENRWRVESRQSSSFEITAPLNYSYAAPGAAPYPRSFEVYATRYDAGDRYIIALPDKCLKFANGGAMLCNDGYQYGQNYSVAISYKGKTVYATAGESGPWNIDDNYWSTVYDPQPRRLFGDLPLGVPEAQAAYFNGYNGGVDQFGRVVTSPVAIDISYAVAADLGLPSGNNKVTVSFLWTEGWDGGQNGDGSDPGPTALPVTPVVAATPNPDGSIIHIVQQGQTLTGIAIIYNTSLQDLLALNGLTLDAIILPGDRIIVRGADPTPTITATRTITNTPKPKTTVTSSAPTESATTNPVTTISTQPEPRVTETADERPPDRAGYARSELVLIIIGGVALVGVVLVVVGSVLRRSS